MVTLALLSMLWLGAPPEVQRPDTRPDPTVPEAGIAPAHVEATEAGPEPDPALAPESPEVEPALAPVEDPALLPEYQPVEPTAPTDASDLPGVDAPVAPGTRRPASRGPGPPVGSGIFGVGAALGAAVHIDQAVTLILCGTQACDRAWIAERLILLSAVGLASGGGYVFGAYQAWADEPSGRVRKTRTKKIVGLTFFGVGLATMVLDAGFTGACFGAGQGPYVRQEEGFAYTCRSGLSAGVQDMGAIAAGLGGAFGFSAMGYERARKKKPLPVGWGVTPMIGAGRSGVRVSFAF